MDVFLHLVVWRLDITIHLINHHLVDQPRSQGLSSEGRKTLVQAGHVSPRKWELSRNFVFPDPTLEGENLSNNNVTYPVLDVPQHQLRREMYETSEKLYVASSSATSSCSLCKAVGGAANNLFDKANCKFLVAPEEIIVICREANYSLLLHFSTR